MVNKFGVKVQWRTYFAGSNITNDQHWYHIADTTREIVFLAQVTSPLLRVSLCKGLKH